MSKHTPYLRDFYRGKKVFLTGGQGFKGIMLWVLLEELGAEVRNVGLTRDDNLLYPELKASLRGTSRELDVREHYSVVDEIVAFQPDVVFHLAAQPIVSVGYADPYNTFSSNVMGTVNVLDGVRALQKKVSVVSVTSDKAYFNAENPLGYVETDKLLGHDPYSASKSAAEHVIHSFKASYFDATLAQEETPSKLVSAARAGNVIGGGDFSLDRLVPDLARGLQKGAPVAVRNFEAMRPYEHVFDAVYAYILLAARQWDDESLVGAYNVGPNDSSIMRNREVLDYFTDHSALEILDVSQGAKLHETTILRLNSEKFREKLSWGPVWGSKQDILQYTFSWYEAWAAGESVTELTFAQARAFLES